MLVPLTREKFNQLIPLVATSQQYRYYWGKFPDFLQRLLISVVIAAAYVLIKLFAMPGLGPIIFLLGLIGAFYWLWGPVFWASMRNVKCRRYKYSGFFRGQILDWWITDELVGKQETVDNRGELVIVENREKRINIEVGDQTGFTAQLVAPLRVEHKVIARGQKAEMVVMSSRPDLSRIEEITDIYIPGRNLWVSDYPYLRRDFFPEVSRSLRDRPTEKPRQRRTEEDWDDDTETQIERPRRRRTEEDREIQTKRPYRPRPVEEQEYRKKRINRRRRDDW